jgi:hypothetical protein
MDAAAPVTAEVVEVVDAVEVVGAAEVVEAVAVDDRVGISSGSGVAPLAPPPTPEERILAAFAAWLERAEYQVPGKWTSAHTMTEAVAGKATAFAAKTVISGLIRMTTRARVPVRMSVQSGGSAQKIAAAMLPYGALTDLAAVQFCALFSPRKSNRIVAVILGDRRRPDEIIQRFQKLMELATPVARLGMRTYGQHMGMMVHPLIVYTNPETCASHGAYILQQGWQQWVWRKIYLQVAVVDMRAKRIEWSKYPGRSLFTQKPPYCEEELADVLNALE